MRMLSTDDYNCSCRKRLFNVWNGIYRQQRENIIPGVTVFDILEIHPFSSAAMTQCL